MLERPNFGDVSQVVFESGVDFVGVAELCGAVFVGLDDFRVDDDEALVIQTEEDRGKETGAKAMPVFAFDEVIPRLFITTAYAVESF